MTITIYHNPKCSNSRTALALIRDSGVEPTIVEYLKEPPSRKKLAELVATMGTGARTLLREKEALCKELGLDDPCRIRCQAARCNGRASHPDQSSGSRHAEGGETVQAAGAGEGIVSLVAIE